ncbi:MAG TPA: hypothetical protein VIM86_03280 [Thermodesulfobacteriota bacterium]
MAVALRHRLEHAAVVVLLALLRFVPPATARRIGEWLGRLAFRLGLRRRIVEANVALAFGAERTPAELAAIVRGAYESFGGNVLEFAALAVRPIEATRAVVEFRHLERLEAARAAGRGVVVLTGHLGAFELGSRVGELTGLPFVVVMKKLSNPYVERALARLRGAGGASLLGVTRGGKERVAGRRVLAHLRENAVVGILNDQDVGDGGLLGEFFGQPTWTGSGPVRFAARAGAALLTGFIHREGGRHIMTVDPPIPVAGDDEASVAAAVAEYNRRLEAAVRAHPEQYFWFHKRWKSTALRERLYASR